MTPREIDVLLATKVMGWTLRPEDDETMTKFDAWLGDDGIIRIANSLEHWKPSEDISAAMEVVEKLDQTCNLHFSGGEYGNATWQCEFITMESELPPKEFRPGLIWAVKASMAISLAALKAFGVKP